MPTSPEWPEHLEDQPTDGIPLRELDDVVTTPRLAPRADVTRRKTPVVGSPASKGHAGEVSKAL